MNPTQVIRDHVPPSLARGWPVAGNPALLRFSMANGFRTTGSDGDLSLYMKVSTVGKALRH